jgi:ribonuclease Z
VANRELVVLGTASQVPTRTRNQNGYLLRWNGDGLLFDPGEGSQRQMLLAGARASEIGWICLTHFHGDHCLGLPGVLQRLSLDGVTRPIPACFPAPGQEWFTRLRHAAVFHERVQLRELPLDGDRVVADTAAFRLEARALAHSVPAFGYRLIEPDGRRMLPASLAAHGVSGPDVGRLQRDGALVAGGRRVRLEEVSEPRPGQRFALIMDTRLCDAAFELAERADMVVCEATFLAEHRSLAAEYGHLTAADAGRIAAASGARLLVLTHFSSRYGADSAPRFAAEAGDAFGGEVVVAKDLDRIPVPRYAG